MKRLAFLAAILAVVASLGVPATAGASVSCTIGTVNVGGYVNPGDLVPGYFFVGEGNEQATCTGGAWYETSQLLIENVQGNFVDEHCGNQGSVCYRLRPESGEAFAAGQVKWCTVTDPHQNPTNDYGANCAFTEVDQDPCVVPMQLTITVWSAATNLPVAVRNSAWICATG